MSVNMKKLLTCKEAREQIRYQGLTVRQWAEERGLSPAVVFEVLGGRKKGNYGESHKAAVLLGIKYGEVAR
jgi:gp16 family phage-associated protein